jgi:hypothetical protein
MTNHSETMSNGKQQQGRALGLTLLVLLTLSLTAAAKELPEAPSAVMMSSSFAVETTVPTPMRVEHRVVETNTVDARFVSLALISTGSTFADSYTTLFARQNWLGGKIGVCNVEVQSAYLYGTHPTVGRAYAVATVKSVTTLAAAYYLRKHHSRFWGAPLLANSIISLQGVTQNMRACN